MNILTTLFLFGWQHQQLAGPVIGSGVVLLFVLVILVGGMRSMFSLRTQP
jgi:hypothetical protein